MNKLLRQVKEFTNRNASTILTVTGSVGVAATSVMAVKATPKAMQLIAQAKEEKGEDLTKMEVVKVAAPVYIPAALVGVSTIACVVGANVLNKRQQAALVSAYAFVDNSYKEYKKKVEELYGEDAHAQIREEIARDKYNDDILVEDDKLLFYDDYSERYFNARMEDVINAEYQINRKISLWGSVHLNEFYELLDIPPVDYGEYLGWSSSSLMDITWADWLEFEHKKVELEDGMECTIIHIMTEPMYDYDYY